MDVVGHSGSGDGMVVGLRWCWSRFRPGLSLCEEAPVCEDYK